MDFQAIKTEELQSSKMKHFETCRAREFRDYSKPPLTLAQCYSWASFASFWRLVNPLTWGCHWWWSVMNCQNSWTMKLGWGQLACQTTKITLWGLNSWMFAILVNHPFMTFANTQCSCSILFFHVFLHIYHLVTGHRLNIALCVDFGCDSWFCYYIHLVDYIVLQVYYNIPYCTYTVYDSVVARRRASKLKEWYIDSPDFNRWTVLHLMWCCILLL